MRLVEAGVRGVRSITTRELVVGSRPEISASLSRPGGSARRCPRRSRNRRRPSRGYPRWPPCPHVGVEGTAEGPLVELLRVADPRAGASACSGTGATARAPSPLAPGGSRAWGVGVTGTGAGPGIVQVVATGPPGGFSSPEDGRRPRRFVSHGPLHHGDALGQARARRRQGQRQGRVNRRPRAPSREPPHSEKPDGP